MWVHSLGRYDQIQPESAFDCDRVHSQNADVDTSTTRLITSFKSQYKAVFDTSPNG